MKKIKITVGTYGYKKNGVPPVRLINSESGPIEVSDEEAARLIGLKRAVEVADTETTVAETESVADETVATGKLDAESLEEYTVAELKDLAGKLGLEFKSRATKDELIKLISATEVEYPVAEDTEDEEVDDEEPPVLNAVDPE